MGIALAFFVFIITFFHNKKGHKIQSGNIAIGETLEVIAKIDSEQNFVFSWTRKAC
jgi:hypothetical protein